MSAHEFLYFELQAVGVFTMLGSFTTLGKILCGEDEVVFWLCGVWIGCRNEAVRGTAGFTSVTLTQQSGFEGVLLRDLVGTIQSQL